MGHKFVVAAALIGAACGVATGYARWHGLFPGYIAHREIVIEMAANGVPKGQALVLGDSTVERVYAGDLCGGAFNAAISWATIADVSEVARMIVPQISPKTIIVGAGENDFKDGISPDEFRARYSRLISTLPPARLILVGVPDFSKGSAIVQSIAREKGASYVPPVEGELTIDGTHENAAGVREWRRRVAAAC